MTKKGECMAKSKVSVSPSTKGIKSKEKLLMEIEKKAYELFLKRKGQHGNDLNDWLEAEKFVKKQWGIK